LIFCEFDDAARHNQLQENPLPGSGATSTPYYSGTYLRGKRNLPELKRFTQIEIDLTFSERIGFASGCYRYLALFRDSNSIARLIALR
jgi:hypothetical protein